MTSKKSRSPREALVSLVLLKYEILSLERDTWHLCGTYPKEVQAKWAWRCAADVEHLAKGHPEAEMCIEMAKKYKDGLVSRAVIGSAIIVAADSTINAYYSARAHYHAAVGATITVVADCVQFAFNVNGGKDKWDLYISWLIEELGEWEEKRALTY